ncbi:MAG TPA: imidazole glycerol phosphate synthase subunit HisH [Bradyrhizobium sp.]|jgi:glutamine amidotransferase|nr:imidazole glycerol-phosphate synthase subunit HisH [Methylobacteriaceae bacterium]HEU0147968.1 imidazole glycerol phosphate synthase subunit HisH [Bradyrhizobium sp.]
MSVAIVDYGSGNLHSAHKALERAARESGSGVEIRLTSNPDDVRNAERIVLPGVGAFADCRRGLDAVDGMVEALNEAVIEKGKPFLGICVGMQLMGTRGLEHKVTEGLGWIPGDVVAIEPADPSLKIPHMGWNTLSIRREHELLDGIPTGENGLHAYFVHSFHLKPAASDLMIAETDYGTALTAIVGRDNLAGTQFHPEKSQTLGLALLRNFLQWRP